MRSIVIAENQVMLYILIVIDIHELWLSLARIYELTEMQRGAIGKLQRTCDETPYG
jgi:hypothetical protein